MVSRATEKVVIDHEQIMKLIRERNRDGIEMLYDRFACVLYGFICKITNNDNEAEEVLKHTFIIAWNNHSDFDEYRQNCHAWLIGIARDLAAKKSSIKPVAENQKDFSCVDSNQLIKELKRELNQEALLMSDEQKKVLELIYFRGVKIDEIAKSMNISVDRTKQLLRGAVNYYRKELQKA